MNATALTTKKIDLFVDFFSQKTITSDEVIMNSYIKAKNRGIKIRIIAEINFESLYYSKKLMSFGEIRHIDGIMGSFGVSEKEYLSVDTPPLGMMPQQALHSSIKIFVQQQQYFFNVLWKKAIPLEQRIQEIENGMAPAEIETIFDPYEIQTKYIHLLEKAAGEILLIFPTLNSMRRQLRIGIFKILKKNIAYHNDLKIRILFPSSLYTPRPTQLNESLKEKSYQEYEYELNEINVYKNNVFI